MTVFKNYKEFALRTGMIFDHTELERLGFYPSPLNGVFTKKQLNNLLHFCQVNKEYHVVTYLNANMIVNRLANGGRVFFLANGDSQKTLTYCTEKLAESNIPVFRAA